MSTKRRDDRCRDERCVFGENDGWWLECYEHDELIVVILEATVGVASPSKKSMVFCIFRDRLELRSGEGHRVSLRGSIHYFTIPTS